MLHVCLTKSYVTRKSQTDVYFWTDGVYTKVSDYKAQAMKATILLAVNLLVAPLVSPPEIAEKKIKASKKKVMCWRRDMFRNFHNNIKLNEQTCILDVPWGL